MMTNNEVLQVAMQQSAWDMNCNPDDFLKDDPVLVISNLGEKAKKYYKEPIACNFISYGSNIVAAAKTEYRDITNSSFRRKNPQKNGRISN